MLPTVLLGVFRISPSGTLRTIAEMDIASNAFLDEDRVRPDVAADIDVRDYFVIPFV